MAKTIVGLYNSFAAAQQVVQALVNDGFPRENISIVASDTTGEYTDQLSTGVDVDEAQVGTGAGVGAGIGAVLGGIGGLLIGLGALAIPGIGPVIAAGPLITALAGAGIGALAGGLVGALVDAGVPEEEARYYAEGVRRGGTLVTVSTSDDMVDRAIDIMNDYNPIDIEEQASQWREGGWTGFDTNATPYTAEDVSRERSRYTTPMTDTDETTMEVVEEDLAVGKREVEREGVRIRSYVTEKPVEGTVRLRDETVDVEVEPTGSGMTRDTASTYSVGFDVDEDDFDTYDTDFHRHYTTNYATSGYPYDQYMPAYRYGYSLANDRRYYGRDWDEIEPEARRYWENQYEGPWENFKDAVWHAWENVKDAVDFRR